MRGAAVWREALEVLLATGLAQAERAVLVGCSAGGLATMLHCDAFREALPPAADVRCVADAGLFVDVTGLAWHPREYFQAAVDLHNSTGSLHPECVSHHGADERWRCLVGMGASRYVRTPLLLVQSVYDGWQLQHIARRDESAPLAYSDLDEYEHCVRPGPGRVCSAHQSLVMRRLRRRVTSVVVTARSESRAAVVLTSCVAHCQVGWGSLRMAGASTRWCGSGSSGRSWRTLPSWWAPPRRPAALESGVRADSY